MADAILVLNAGSSGLKFSVFRLEQKGSGLLARGQVEGVGTAPRLVLRSAGVRAVPTNEELMTANHKQS